MRQKKGIPGDPIDVSAKARLLLSGSRDGQVAIRLPIPLLKATERLAPLLSASLGKKANRSDVLRVAMAEFVAEHGKVG